MNTLQFEIKVPAGQESALIAIDDTEMLGITGLSVTGDVENGVRASLDMAIHELHISTQGQIVLNVSPVSDGIGFRILESLLEHFMSEEEWRAQTINLCAKYFGS